MPKAFIKMAYKQVINAASQGSFEKNILKYSYEEFLLKSQAYNPEKKFRTFTELKVNDGRANSLHYKCSFAIAGFIDALKKQIPLLKDSMMRPVSFDTYQFEVIASDITDKSSHIVAINYLTDTLTLYDIIGDYMVLAYGDKSAITAAGPAETFLLQVQPNLSIFNYREIKITDCVV